MATTHTPTPAPFFLGRPGRSALAFQRHALMSHPQTRWATDKTDVNPRGEWSTIAQRLGGRELPIGRALYEPIDPLRRQPAAPIANPEETTR